MLGFFLLFQIERERVCLESCRALWVRGFHCNQSVIRQGHRTEGKLGSLLKACFNGGLPTFSATSGVKATGRPHDFISKTGLGRIDPQAVRSLETLFSTALLSFFLQSLLGELDQVLKEVTGPGHILSLKPPC